MPFNKNNPIVIKERNGDSDTRVIIKVGYSTGNWRTISENVVYSPSLNMYVFSFPNDAKKLNYTYANLITSGTNEEDNVKYCYGTNIGSAVLPSKENCYRVSKENSYTIKIINPRVMHKEYELNDDLTQKQPPPEHKIKEEQNGRRKEARKCWFQVHRNAL
jgi:hypothetical protein